VGDETIRGWLPPRAPDSEPPGRWDSKLPPSVPTRGAGADPGDAGEPGGDASGDPGANAGGGDGRRSGIPTGFRREPGR
jgi:hypothetical protein